MTWWTALKAGITIVQEVYKFLREVEKQGLARLGPEASQRDRRRLQRLAVWFHEGENIGLRRLTKLDDGVDKYLRDLLQSDLLEVYLSETTSTLDRETARKAIMAGADGKEEPRVYPVH